METTHQKLMVVVGDKKIIQQKALEIDANYEINKDLFNDLYNYFIGAEGNLDIKKGIMINGSIGSGKTSLFKIFLNWILELKKRHEVMKYNFDKEQIIKEQNIFKKQFKIIPIRKVEKEFNENGYKGLDLFTYNKKPSSKVQNEIIENPENIMFDDVGTERAISKNYSTDINIFSELIKDRYELWQHENIMTHFTTNIPTEMLKNRYESRVYSRLIEMFNIVTLKTTDYRTSKAKEPIVYEISKK